MNEETIDGKNTTHCMAMVLFQERSSNRSYVESNIPREGPYALSEDETDLWFLHILKYNKPPNRQ